MRVRSAILQHAQLDQDGDPIVELHRIYKH